MRYAAAVVVLFLIAYALTHTLPDLLIAVLDHLQITQPSPRL